jgi:hypothetical protein
MSLIDRYRGAAAGAVALSMLLGNSLAAGAPVVRESTFDTDAEEWSISGKATGPFFHPTDGNPGGHINADDAGTVATSYWNAPGKFLGDTSSAYGKTLSYDVACAGDGKVFKDIDVVMIGNGLEMRFQFGKKKKVKKNRWTHRVVKLTEKKGWKLSTGAKPTAQQFQSVLAALDTLRIRGEFILGPETFALDNVILEADPPAPSM